ncbi:MAG TPA: tetratricopeptide repeat protein, partial [Thermoanaerobaculia bacterium]|nr:tetratricopeptide repeat protein [Thermoanaerobaculia bacterium]
VREVAAMLGLSASQIRAWASKGFLKPERGPRGEMRFGFHDLIMLRTAGELSAANISERKVRRALQRLREQIPKDRSLTGMRIVADGERIVVSDGDAVWNPESGQALFDFAVDDIAARTAPLAHRAAAEALERADELTAEEWFELGCDLENSSPREAKDAYQRALSLDPDFADAHVNLGRLLHEEGSPLAAETHYRRALAIEPRHDIAAFNLGVALEDLGRIREAAEAYRHALELDDRNADAHYNLAGVLERRGEKAAALRHLKEYARLRKGTTDR